MKPWYKGFTGDIQAKNVEEMKTFSVKGKFEVISDKKLEITELPIHKWTREYKNFLEDLAKKDEIEDIKEFHKDN